MQEAAIVLRNTPDYTQSHTKLFNIHEFYTFIAYLPAYRRMLLSSFVYSLLVNWFDTVLKYVSIVHAAHTTFLLIYIFILCIINVNAIFVIITLITIL